MVATPTPATFKSLAATFDFGRYTTLVDIGGSAGTLCCTITAAHPHMRCRTLDLPPVLAAAQSEIKRRGLEGRVEAGSIDFFEEAFPAADVITMSMILHDCEWMELAAGCGAHVRPPRLHDVWIGCGAHVSPSTD